MNARPILHLISFILLVLGSAMLVCLAASFFYGDPAAAQRGLLLSAGGALAAGALLWALTRHDMELTRRDGMGIVTFGWIAACLVGSLPYVLTGTTASLLDALFETVSGLTTTGASVIPDPGIVPRGVLLWRALTNFFGGMGILVFCVAILPLLGSGGMQVYRAEMSGVAQDRLRPRITSTAKLLWGVYVGMNVVLTVLLRLGGMPWFDAVCHAMATLATGGFSTQSASIAAYHSLYIEIVLIAFMLLGAMNFALHYRALHGGILTYVRDGQVRFFLGFWAVLCLTVTLVIWRAGYPDFAQALRAAVFSVTSLLTTTGFCTDDFDTWPAAAKTALLLAMLAGGCAGSTSGGIKQMRVMVVLKSCLREVWLFIHPQAVFPLKMGGRPIEATAVAGMVTYFGLYLVVFAAASLLVSFFTSAETALSSVASTLGGVGPGFGMAGATETYLPFPVPAKLILIFCMLLGRLEFYALLALLLPRFWRR